MHGQRSTETKIVVEKARNDRTKGSNERKCLEEVRKANFREQWSSPTGQPQIDTDPKQHGRSQSVRGAEDKESDMSNFFHFRHCSD